VCDVPKEQSSSPGRLEAVGAVCDVPKEQSSSPGRLEAVGAVCDVPENDVLKGRSSRNPEGFEA
jgi:hypothetical protein